MHLKALFMDSFLHGIRIMKYLLCVHPSALCNKLNQTADYANRGLDAASEERKREQQRKREELDGKSRERDEAARNVNKPTGGDENGNGSGSANSYGKGD